METTMQQRTEEEVQTEVEAQMARDACARTTELKWPRDCLEKLWASEEVEHEIEYALKFKTISDELRDQLNRRLAYTRLYWQVLDRCQREIERSAKELCEAAESCGIDFSEDPRPDDRSVVPPEVPAIPSPDIINVILDQIHK